jgi:hypothetical protein
MASPNIITDLKDGLNSIDYLEKKEHDLFFVSSSREYSFGNSEKDVLEIGIYNQQKEISSYFTITGSKKETVETYRYFDTDGNAFDDVYSPNKNTPIQDPEKNVLLSIKDVVSAGNVSANNFYLLVNPIFNYFSKDKPLIVKEISNSRKEVKLIKSFKSYEVSGNHVAQLIDGKVVIDGDTTLKFAEGIVHVIKVIGTDVRNIRFSKANGTANQSKASEYLVNVIYKPKSNEIILDATETVPKVLYVYENKSSGESTTIKFSEKVDREDFRLNTEFNSFGKNKFIHKEIFDEISYEISSIKLAETFSNTKRSYSDLISTTKTLLSFQTDNDVLQFLSSIYYGSSEYDFSLGKTIKLPGVVDYIKNHFKFNFEFLGDFVDLNQKFSEIVDSVVLERIKFYNSNAEGRATSASLKLSRNYAHSLLFGLLKSSVSTVEYNYNEKYKSPLKLAINLGKGDFHHILSFKLENKNELWVKLKSPLPLSVTVGGGISISNISIIPTVEMVSYSSEKLEKVIKLKTPNFSLSLNEPSNRTLSTKYYNGEDLEVAREEKNKISVNKKLIDLNTDYSDFSNFVVFSSANLRIKIFKNKYARLTTLSEEIDELTAIDPANSEASDRYSVYSDLERKKLEYDQIIDGFDGYESYLYKSGLFVYDTNLSIFVEESGSSTASSAVEDLLLESEAYDKNNRDSLLNNTPDFIYEDSDNDDYLKFLSMVGHHFDNIYLHITNIGIYKNVGKNISDGLTGKIVSYVLNSLGFKLPPGLSGLIESADTVENYLSSDEKAGLPNSISVDEKTKTIWKRMLINLPSIYKSKGTEECIRQIFSIYGIPNNLITLREFGGGWTNNDVSSSYFSEEKEYLLEFMGEEDEYVRISGSSWLPFKSIDFKVHIDQAPYSSSRIIVPLHEKINYDSATGITAQAYSLGFVKTGKSLGRFYFFIQNTTSTFTTLTEPIYLFSDEPMSVMLRRNYIDDKFDVEQSASTIPIKYDLKVYRASAGGKNIDIQTSFYLSGSLNDTFDAQGYFAFGNSGLNEIEIISEILEDIESEDSSFDFIKEYSEDFTEDAFSGYSLAKFRGCLDRFVIQSTPLSDENFIIRGKNLGSYYQGEPTSSYEDILFRFNLGIPFDFSSASLTDAGYDVSNLNRNFSSSFATLYNFSGSNVTSSLGTGSCLTQSYSYFPHQTKEFIITNEFYTDKVGPSRLENGKVNYFRQTEFDNQLSHEKFLSTKPSYNKFLDSNKIGVFVSPIHERNKDILNFYGNHDIIASISEPSDRYGKRYLKLDELRRQFYRKNMTNKILFNELFSIYKIFIDKSIFETLKLVLPARSKVYSGILIEGTILERSKLEQKPVDILEIRNLNTDIDLKNLVGQAEIISTTTSSVDISYISQENFSGNSNSFNGFGCILDRDNEFNTNVFLDGGSIYTQYNGEIYRVYKKNSTKQKDFFGGRQTRKTVYSIELVPSGSSLYMASYQEVSDVHLFRQINRKPLPFRNSVGKSRQTELTTINIDGIEDRSPVIRINTGPNIKNTNAGLKV